MNRMWSPWRSSHLGERREPDQEGQPDESVFSGLVREDRDRENLILWRGQGVFFIMNLYPYNNGHLMIVPYREAGTGTPILCPPSVKLKSFLKHWPKHTINYV